MNNTISLPRLRSNSEFSKPLLSMERKKSVDRKKVESIKEKRLQNDEQQTRNVKNQKPIELKRAKSQLFKKRKVQSEAQEIKQKKYGLLQNGKLSKITEKSIISKTLSSDRTKSSKLQHYDKQQAGNLKKQLNEIISSILILKKQIKSIQGGTLQVRQQIKNILENSPQQNSSIEKKIQEIKKKTQNYRYDQQVLKNMKERMKKINIFYEKKSIQLKQILERQERKIKILNQRSSIREESINKQKMIVKVVEQKQKTINRLNQQAAHDYEKKMRMLNEQRQIAQKKATLKMINENEYHLEVYKKQQAKLFQQLRANQFLKQLLDSRWNKYSEIYGDAEKTQKLMQMHSLQKINEDFDPRKIYYGSFENKKQLQEKIKDKQMKLAELMKRNTQLQKLWKNVQFKQIDEQQTIIDKKSLEIKTGKVEQKQIIEKKQRQLILEMRQKLEKSKLRAAKMSRIKDWVLKLENQIQIKPLINSKIEERLIQVINWMKKQFKQQKDIKSKTL